MDRQLRYTIAIRQARGHARGVVSRKIKEIADLMTDESNVDEVMKGSIELEKTFKKFQDAHEALLIGD